MATKTRLHNIFFNAGFLNNQEREQIEQWAKSVIPLWERRYGLSHPPPEGDHQRPLLRPVYWLGNWQFACLGYYEPPEGVKNRAIRAQSFPAFLKKIVEKIEAQARRSFAPQDLPQEWELNTCLVNYYGDILQEDKWLDRARVGEHKDFEPGPVASLSLGERGLFQFVTGKPQNNKSAHVIHQVWLNHGSLLLFGGKKWKEDLFHRIQRVEKKSQWILENKNAPGTPLFKTRRLNLTFRYVPKKDWVDFKDLPQLERQDIQEYVETLALHCPHFKAALQT